MGIAAAVLLVTVGRGAQLAALPDRGYFVKYTTAADAVLAGSPPVQRLGDLSPGYLWFVTAVRATLGPSPTALRTVQLLALGLTAWLCALLALRLAGRLAAWTAAAAFLLLRAPLVNASEAEPETLLALALAVALALLLPARPRAWEGVAGGLALGVAATTRPTALAVAMALWAWLALARSRRQALLAALATLLPFATAVLVNARLTGTAAIMNPGTVFYEGMNPFATGYLGEAPRIVKELEGTLAAPDALHEAYRQVAGAASGRPAAARDSNRYWTARALAFASAYPGAAIRLILRKAYLSLHSHEAWDLLTMERKDRLLARGVFLPFGALLALAGLGVLHRRREAPVVALAVAAALPLALMSLFYVSSRQRCAALPPLAVLAGLGTGALALQWRAGQRRQVVIATGGVLVVALLLRLDGHLQREDRHGWTATLRAADARREAARTSDPALQAHLLALADSWTPWRRPVAGASDLRAVVQEALATETLPARRFDLALAAARIGDWPQAAQILASLDRLGYRPVRGAVAVSSVAYYRARAALRIGRPEEVRALVDRALHEAPGDPWVLALAASLADPKEREALSTRLSELHDPITAAVALARAAADVGDVGRAASHLAAAAAAAGRPAAALAGMVD